LPTSSEDKGLPPYRGTGPILRRLHPGVVGFLVLLLLWPVPARTAGESGTTLVILSLDGVRHDYPDRVRGGAFSRLRREGVRARRMEPPFPASTLPAHATLATGCHPERHGILNSRFRDARRGEFNRSNDPDWLACEPLWVSAERQGIKSGVLNWFGSYGAWRGTRATRHDEAYRERTDRETVGIVLRWLRLPAGRRPRLIMATLKGVDHPGHRYGPDSAEVERRLRFEDGVLSFLLDRVETLPDGENVNLVIVSDHGMARRGGSLDPAAALSRARIRNRTFCSGGSANVYLERRRDRDRAREVLSGMSGLEVFPVESLPEDLRYRFPGRTGDLVLVAPVGTKLGREPPEPEGVDGGAHGYRGSEEAMGGIFFGWGPAFRRGGEIDRIRAVDLYSIACRLLGIRPSGRQQGRVPPGVLRAP
jgi:predicted AlkP superfamily pyrophosphatase or phosphodiesterase